MPHECDKQEIYHPSTGHACLGEWRDVKTVCVGGTEQTDGAEPFR